MTRISDEVRERLEQVVIRCCEEMPYGAWYKVYSRRPDRFACIVAHAIPMRHELRNLLHASDFADHDFDVRVRLVSNTVRRLLRKKAIRRVKVSVPVLHKVNGFFKVSPKPMTSYLSNTVLDGLAAC